MKINGKEIFAVTAILFAVVDIMGTLPLVISLREQVGKIDSKKASIVAGVIMISFVFIGESILYLIGIDIYSFAVAGSFIIFILSIEMILGIELFKIDSIKNASMFPIAFPLIAGAGTLTTILSIKSQFHDINIIIGIIINILIVYTVLKLSKKIETFLGNSGIGIIRKVFGVILLSIAIKLFASNINGLTKIHNKKSNPQIKIQSNDGKLQSLFQE